MRSVPPTSRRLRRLRAVVAHEARALQPFPTAGLSWPVDRWSRGAWGAAAGAAIGGALGSKAARRRIVPGSIKNESYVGTSADGKFHGAKIGAIYTAPGGREVLVKGIIGVSQKPTAKNKVHVAPAKNGVNVTVKPAQAKRTQTRGKPTAGKMHTQSAGSKVPTGTTGRRKRADLASSASAGRKVRR